MTAPRPYATAGALRAALEARLHDQSRRDRVDLQRLRRQVAFDRLLARMFDPTQPGRDDWVLKGGYALEMRYHRARSTKDLDLTVGSRSGARGGARFPVDARLDGRTFARFHVDLGVGDDVLEPLEQVVGEDWLGFAGIPALSVPALSAEQHWAEKLHAYEPPLLERAVTPCQRAAAGSNVIVRREPVAFARRSRAAVEGLT